MQSINGASIRVLDSSIERIALKTFELLLKFTECRHVHYRCRPRNKLE